MVSDIATLPIWTIYGFQQDEATCHPATQTVETLKISICRVPMALMHVNQPRLCERIHS